MRKLAAIMFTDIVGYTALMGNDEQKALQLLQKNRGLLKPIIEQFRGEWLKEMGDGTLSSFASAVDAVNCALAIQQVLKDDPDLKLRIGIHIGDVVFEGGDVFGDGVNVASRLEPLAEPGGICVSERVYEDIRNKAGIEAASIGEKTLKGVENPVKVYTVTAMGALPRKPAWPSITNRSLWTKAAGMVVVAMVAVAAVILFPLRERDTHEVAVPRLGEKSIAVLPFANLSDSKEDEYFSDGVTDDIITHLAKIGDLKVISRTSVMLYKDSPKSLRVIADELGVSNILEGSVRRAGDKVRITGQLIDARTDEHLWAESYDRDLADIFAIQSDVARKIATALKAILSPEERQRLEQRPTASTAAYDYYLRAYDYERQGNERKTLEIASDLYQKAIAVDSSFAQAYARLGLNHLRIYWYGYDRTSQRLAMAWEAVDKALRLKPDDPVVRVANGYYYYWGSRDYARALEEFYFAQRVEPGNGLHARNIAYIQRRLGKFEEAVVNQKIALEYDPRSSRRTEELGATYRVLRRFDLAEQYFDRALELAPDNWLPYISKAGLQVYRTGNTKSARQLLAGALRLADPSQFSWTLVDFDIEDSRYSDALARLTSIPEDVWIGQRWFTPKDAYVGWIYKLMEKPEEARRHHEKARVLLEEKVREDPNDARVHTDLGKVYAHLGLADEAIRESRQAVDGRNQPARGGFQAGIGQAG
ncbi:MAG: hypothetical protein IIA60_06830 [Candidatus Marinimicrobia bacterium]|nr:hypothetical protein [Candidatus Neomarinimicrobiota bacterium]